MSESHFLWPQGKPWRAIVQISRIDSVKSVEGKLASMFQGGEPVLCSSGRAALILALLGSGLSRADTVSVFPYASHCVLDAVSRIATPQPWVADAQEQLRVVFHQWGYVQERDLAVNDIEDSADTLVVPGGRLFPGGGAYEIWSLPKILGTTGGGILWCQSSDTANQLRQLRDVRGGGMVQWLLRLLGTNSRIFHAWWQGGEGEGGLPSCFQIGEIVAALSKWPVIVADRQRKIEMAWPLALPWLVRSEERLPCVVPTLVGAGGGGLALELGLSAGLRTMEKIEQNGQRALVKVLPIPVHQDVSLAWLRRVLDRLGVRSATTRGC